MRPVFAACFTHTNLCLVLICVFRYFLFYQKRKYSFFSFPFSFHLWWWQRQLGSYSLLSILRYFTFLNPKLLAYIDFIYSAAMQILQLNRCYFLLKLQFTSHTWSTPHGQLGVLAFHFSCRGLYFKRHTKSFVELAT